MIQSISMYITYLKSIIVEVVAVDQHYVEVRERLQRINVQHRYKD
jgi:hypothetical protein